MTSSWSGGYLPDGDLGVDLLGAAPDEVAIDGDLVGLGVPKLHLHKRQCGWLCVCSKGISQLNMDKQNMPRIDSTEHKSALFAGK